MDILKFGGASVKSPSAVKNLLDIIKKYKNKEIVIVISAMGKMTNAFEKLMENIFHEKEKSEISNSYNEIKKYHFDIVEELFENKENNVFIKINFIFNQINEIIENENSKSYDFLYAQLISFGEILSTTIVSCYLNCQNINNEWVDIRKFLKTDNNFREAKVEWESSTVNIREEINFKNTNIYITQGFISSDKENNTTTLGREGSDFTGAILSYILDAQKFVCYKDVAGVFNADPSIFENTKLLSKISYQEAIELTYFGAKVIHQKTIKPLQNKQIPLFVKSFIEPEKTGTKIYNFKEQIEPKIPVFIIKENQILISISPKDFSFVAEESISLIYNYIVSYGIKVNLMQNSALNFSISVNNNPIKVERFISEIKENFKVRYNNNLKLITIRHYTEQSIIEITKGKKIFVEQKSRNTVRIIC